jgi:hypothetical protein
MAELALIGITAEDFVNAVEAILTRSDSDERKWLKRVDGFLSTMSWDRTHASMRALIAYAVTSKAEEAQEAKEAPAAHARGRRVAQAESRFDVALEA